jgi:hypothetical protein
MARLIWIQSRHLMGQNIQLTKDGGFGEHRDSKHISLCTVRALAQNVRYVVKLIQGFKFIFSA